MKATIRRSFPKLSASVAGVLALAFVPSGSAQDSELRKEATAAMRKAAEFYREKVAYRGGYVYYYSPDLRGRLGEGVATPTQIWVQPPGTPTVGMALLKAYAATGDRYYLEGAVEAAEALRYGQLKSGAWRQVVDFDPRSKKAGLYRNGRGQGRNHSTLDDDQSQSAIRLMMRTDKALNFRNPAIHESASVALDALLKAQFPNGAFPQVWTEPVKPQKVIPASYPEYDWRTEGKIKNYWDMYTLNDGLAGTVSEVLIEAHEIYGNDRYLEALKQLGDFLILAQMPEPQPAWAQQYGYHMHPIWARRFEPPAIAARETEDALGTLMKIYRHTRDRKYLEPIPKALAYLKRSRLPDGKLARYYELRSNRPLYMERSGKNYSLTYSDANLPSHYGWKNEPEIGRLEAEYEDLVKQGPVPKPKPTVAQIESAVRQIVGGLDRYGRWITRYRGQPLVGQPKFRDNAPFISSAVFSHNLETISEYLQAIR